MCVQLLPAGESPHAPFAPRHKPMGNEAFLVSAAHGTNSIICIIVS